MDIDKWVLTHSRLSKSRLSRPIVRTKVHYGIRDRVRDRSARTLLGPRDFPRNPTVFPEGLFLPPHASSLLESKETSCERYVVRKCIKLRCS